MPPYTVCGCHRPYTINICYYLQPWSDSLIGDFWALPMENYKNQEAVGVYCLVDYQRLNDVTLKLVPWVARFLGIAPRFSPDNLSVLAISQVDDEAQLSQDASTAWLDIATLYGLWEDHIRMCITLVIQIWEKWYELLIKWSYNLPTNVLNPPFMGHGLPLTSWDAVLKRGKPAASLLD